VYFEIVKEVRYMDAKKIGSFIADQRKALGLTQAGLAEKLHVTDKAVSRWERGQGFPDINSIEPLADALEVSIAEIMKGERTPTGSSDETESLAAKNVISLVEMKREEHKKIFAVVSIVALLLFCILLIDVMGLMGFIGVALPCLGLIAGVTLFGVAIMRRRRKLPIKAIVICAVILVAIPVAFAVLLVLAGMLGVGPVPN